MNSNADSRLSASDLRDFLEGPHVAHLACLDDANRSYIIPVWHEWDGERFWVVASERAKWVSYIQQRPSVALSIDETGTTTRVLCQGSARYVEGPVADGAFMPIALRMAARYLGNDAVPQYQHNTAGMRRWLFAIDVETLVSWRGASRTD
jgi:hypothetical protein